MNTNTNILLKINRLLDEIKLNSELLHYITIESGKIQGKGYGAASIDQEIAAVIQLLNKQPQLIMDIGGNIGNYSANLRKRFPAANIHIFEPSLTNIASLKKRFSDDNNIKIIPNAISDRTGLHTLYSDAPGSGLGSLTKRRLDHFNIKFETSETVQSLCFEDYWLNILNRQHIDIAKIDIEGHELNALIGFGESIQHIKVIQFEFGGCNIDTRTYFQDFWYFFKEYHYDMYRITPYGFNLISRYNESDEFFSCTNYIAVNRNC